MPKDLAETMMDLMRDQVRERTGLSRKTPQELFEIAHRIVDLLPVDAMKAHVEQMAKSRSEMDRLQARQLAVLLFAKKEMDDCLRSLTPEQSVAIARELGMRR